MLQALLEMELEQRISLKKYYALRENFFYDLPTQRGDVWDNKARSELVQSLIAGYPIGTIYINEVDKVLRHMDGRQRSTTIRRLFDNELKISDDIDDIEVVVNARTMEKQVISIAGKLYDEFDSNAKQILDTRIINIMQYKNLSIKQESEMTKRVNSNKPLTVVEKTRMATHEHVQPFVDVLLKKQYFDRFLKVTNQSINNKVKDYVAHQIIAIELGNEVLESSFDEKVLGRYIEQVDKNDALTKEIKNKINDVVDYLSQAFAEAKVKFLTPTNAAIVYKIAQNAIRDGVQPLYFGGLVQMFNNDLVDFKQFRTKDDMPNGYQKDYILASASGGKAMKNIQTRIDILSDYYDKNINKAEEYKLEKIRKGRAKQTKTE